MESQPDHLSALNRHIQTLEEKVATLRASLSHWQQWYLDYAALKEEIENLPANHDEKRKLLARIRRDFEGDVLTRKELNELMGKHDLKEPATIVNLLARRIDYVDQNVATLDKLLRAEEERLAAATIVANPDGGTDEETGLPITDIIEELDEDGNVVNSRLQRGHEAAPKILDALKQAGVEDGHGEGTPATASDAAPKTSSKQPVPRPQPNPISQLTQECEAKSESLSTSDEGLAATGKKSVSFAEDTKPGHVAESAANPTAAQRLGEIMAASRQQEAVDLSKAVLPDDETENDRELRRQMLEYGMSEIGPVVAELDLEEEDTDGDYDDYSESQDEGDEEDDENGNVFQPSKHSVITNDYITRMKELEKKLGFKSAFTTEPREEKMEVPEEGIGKISVVRESNESIKLQNDTSSASVDKKKAKKGVKFAPQLDIAEDADRSPKPSDQPKEFLVNPVGDIVERRPSAPTNTTAFTTNKRPSRFKQAQASSSLQSIPPNNSLPRGPHQVPSALVKGQGSEIPPVPSGPEGNPLASSIVERQVNVEAKEPDGMDDALMYQAAAAEYNRLRNRMIQKQGGFVKPDESPYAPLDEEDGGPKRVSRFKAARLARQ